MNKNNHAKHHQCKLTPLNEIILQQEQPSLQNKSNENIDAFKKPNSLLYKLACYLYQSLKYILNLVDNLVNAFRNKYGNDNLAYLLVFISGLFYVGVSFYLKKNKQIFWSYAMIVRGVIVSFLMYSIGYVKKYNMQVNDSKDFKLLTIRNVISALGQVCFFYSINKLPVSLLLIISNTGPIFVFIFNYFLFGVTLTIKDIIGIAVSFFGVVMVSDPNYFQSLFMGETTSVQENNQYIQGTEKYILIAISILTWLGWALAIIIVRYMKSINTFEINISLCFFFILFGSIGVIQSETPFDLSLSDVLGLIFIIGLASFMYQITFITATTITKNHGPITLINYTMIVESFLVEVIFFQEVPSVFEIVGSMLVLFGLASYFLSKLQKK
ncbi:hypothetical protein ABPG74_020283 [Tetrahymena malaccensis]